MLCRQKGNKHYKMWFHESKGDSLGKALDTGVRAFSSLLPEHSEKGHLIVGKEMVLNRIYPARAVSIVCLLIVSHRDYLILTSLLFRPVTANLTP